MGQSYSSCERRRLEPVQREMKDMLRGNLEVEIHEARNLRDDDWFVSCDPYVVLYMGEARIAKTDVKKKTTFPKWFSDHVIAVVGECSEIRLNVKDKTVGSMSKTMGSCSFPVKDLLQGTVEGWFVLTKDHKITGEIYCSLKYTHTEVEADAFEVPNTYFPLRKHCCLTPFQDACCEDFTNKIGFPENDRSTWKSLQYCLEISKKMIYIVGWAVWIDTILVREAEEVNAERQSTKLLTIGDLLKQKAEEGVIVMILIWDEKFSNSLIPGMMGTHDEETKKFFDGTKVICNKVYRPRGKFSGNVGTMVKDVLFTHHQKTVIVDIPSKSRPTKRRLVSFIGGLDLCNGRYDRPKHDLFGTLKTSHAKDFHQCLFPQEEGGPREPWHDIHALVEGPIAYDVLVNFMERFRREVPQQAKFLLSVEEFDLENDPIPEEEKVERHEWRCQLFRSIDVRAATFSQTDGLDVNKRKFTGALDRLDKRRKHILKKLDTRSGRLVDASIQKAYVHHIRRAKRFVYIENQYFIGSSPLWSPAKSGADNLVPAEIAYKTADMIRKGKDFAVYIVVPMWPEGFPETRPIQEILFWQYQTVSMIYRIVAEALRKANSSLHPTDYIQFLCLGNRETPQNPASTQSHIKHGRCPIYCHSKMMIVDDEYILIGSANINQRSMSGTRDTEIAVGGYQPRHVSEAPEGSIHRFRLSLFLEHLGYEEFQNAGGIEKFRHPEILETRRLVRKLSRKLWDQYVSPENQEMEGHLLQYPYHIAWDGRTQHLPGFFHFPGTQATIVGNNYSVIPDLLSM